jgi:hypothetical protein
VLTHPFLGSLQILCAICTKRCQIVPGANPARPEFAK